ncbi:hypothetical protein PLESTM_001194100 [Pleodorina starrii]|nr:hypothetical protein PLESTM_001194100 [Pleodorina starrii]
MSGLAGVTRRATAGSGRSRRNMYLGDFDTESADQATSTLPLSGGIFKNAAFEILKQEERLMTSGEITKLAMERKLLRCMGKTPENTMASALYTEVRKKASTTVFIKPKEGLFGLKAWLSEPWLLNWLAQEGIDVADVHDPGGAAEPVPKKLRTSYNGAASRAAAGGAGAGGVYYSHRTSSSTGVPPLMRSSSAGPGASLAGAAAAANGAQRASLSGYGAPGQGSGGGIGARGASYSNLAAAGAVAGGGAGGGIPKPMYSAGGRGAGGGVAAPGEGASAGETLTSLHLLVDAADEIEGGPEDAAHAIARAPPSARRRSDGVLRQTSFRRQRPAISRETSLPSMIARVRVRDDFEDEQDAAAPPVDTAVDEDGEFGEGEEPYDASAALHHRMLQQQQQQRQQSSSQVYQHAAAAAAAAAAASAAAQLQHQQESVLEQQQAFGGQRLPQQQPMVLPPLLPPLLQHPHHPHHHHLQQQQQQQLYQRRHQHAEEGSEEEEDGEQQQEGNVGPEGQELEAEAAEGGRWPGADSRHLHPHHRHRHHPGVFRGARGGRGGGRAGPADGARAARRGRGRAGHDPGRRGGRGGDTDEGEGQVDEGEDEGEEGSGDEAEEEAEAPPPRRWALPPRHGTDRRGGRGGAAAAGRLRQAGVVQHRLHPDVALPPHLQMHVAAVQLPIPLVQMQVPPGALGPGHVLHRMQMQPSSSASLGAVPEHLRAVLGYGAAAVPGLGLGPGTLPGLLGQQAAMLGMGLPPGLAGVEMGALLGEGTSPAELCAAAAAAAQAAAAGAGPCGGGYPLPPALMQIASVLGRSPGLSATLVSAQARMAELGGASREAMEDGGGSAGAGALREARKVERGAELSGDAHPIRSRDPRVAAGKGAPAKRAGGPAAAAAAGRSLGSSEAAGADGGDAGDVLSTRPSEGGGGDDAAAEGPGSTQQQQQQHQRDSLLRAPTSLSPAGGPSGTSIAVNDAMNSPDSQLAGGADRASPATEDPSGPSRGGQADRRPAAASDQPNDADVAGTRPCSSGGAAVAAAPAAGAGASPASGPASGGQASGGAWAQLTLLQQQHLKLLLPVEPARPGDVPDPDSINRIHQQVLDMESRMGALHPETGRAYVLLARVLEHKGTCWSLAMAERALMRAWTIVGVVSSSRRRSSEGDAGAAGAGAGAAGASTVAGVAEAAAAEAGAGATPGEMLGELPDSFHTFHYLLEQIRMKQSYLQAQQEQRLRALLQMVEMMGVPAAAAIAAAAGGDGMNSGAAAAAAAALGSMVLGGGAALLPGACGEAGYGPVAGGGGGEGDDGLM